MGYIMDSNALGKYLRSLRKSHGYTQEFVASKLNIIHQTYSHYETGRISPPADSLYLLAKLYNISADQLLYLTLPDSLQEEASPKPSHPPSDELADYLNYINEPEHYIKYRHLSSSEKRMLYYFQKLSHMNQDKILEILKLEIKFQKSEGPPGALQE